MSEILKELDEISQLIEEDRKDGRAEMLDALKEDLADASIKLKHLKDTKFMLESRIKEINIQMSECESEIRCKWGPFLGADSAEIVLNNGVVLSASPTINVSIEDNERMTNWLLNNGYEGAMKYQIHNMTMKKIAREEFEKGTVIPGLKYDKFTVIKVK